MRILITGASGYVASYVVAELERDHEIVLVGRRPPGAGRRAYSTAARFIQGDLINPEDCRRAVELWVL